MTTRALSKTQRLKWIRHLEAQGCRIRVTKNGLLVHFPDGGIDNIHYTLSDRRSTKNAISKFRRHGVVHPLDTRGET